MSQATMPIGTAPATVIGLRDYQRAAIDAVHERRAAGVTRQLISLPTGAGKTYVAAHLVSEIGLPTVFMVHRDELVSQTLRQMRQVNPGLSLGVCKAEQDDVGADIIIASAQTLARQPRLDRLRRAVGPCGLFISDECFPAGTLIDGRPIETVRVGDIVTAFNEASGEFALRRVRRLFRRQPVSTLCRIVVGSRVVVCTPNHPFWTPDGWTKAEDLYAGKLLAVRSDHHGALEASALQGGPGRASVLHPRVPLRLDACGDIGAYGGDQPKARFGAHEDEQSDAQGRHPGTNEGHSQGNWAQATGARRQWHGPHGSSSGAAGSTRRRMGAGVRDSYDGGEELGQRAPAGLQSGHWAFSLEGGSGSGRALAWSVEGESGGREEDGLAHWGRVDRVEVHEPGSDGRYGGLCPDGFVYNFEVEEFHTYVANGFVVHNCHHDAAETRQRAIREMEPALLVGLTATPMRGDRVGLDMVYDEIVYHLPMLDLIANNMLARLVGLRIDTETELDAVHTRAGEFAEDELANAVDTPERNELIVQSWRKHASDRKRTVAFCVNRKHAMDLRDAFRAAGIGAEMVLGETPPDERARIFAEFHAGRLPVLTNCMVLTEGYDEPAIDCILMTRPTKSQGLFIQCVGRGARKSPGKADCLVIDFVDLTSRHKLVGFPSLLGELDEVPEGSSSATPEPLAQGELVDLLELAQKRAKVRERAAVFVNLFGASPFVWRDVRGQFMSKTSRGEWLTLFEEDDGFVPVLITPGNQPTVTRLFDRPVDSETAMAIAESKIEVSPLTDRNARWRNAPERATEGQQRAARAWKVALPPNCTKGQASELIDAAVFASVMRKVTGRAG